MKDFIDYVEYTRPNEAKVRISFEMMGIEVLFFYCEYRHAPKTEWKALSPSTDGYHHYSIINTNGQANEYSIQYPTDEEIKQAQQLIANRSYNMSI